MMDDVLTRMWNHKLSPWFYSAFCILLITGALLVIQLPKMVLPYDTSFNQLSCSDLGHTNQSSKQPEINILIPAHIMAKPLLSRLCEQTLLTTSYGEITVNWLPRGKYTPQTLYNQTFDVMWARDYQLAGLTPDYSDYYRILLKLPGYDVFWFANQAIDDQFLKTHQIGLLDDKFSRSGYQLPVQVLKQLSIDVTSSQIVLYPTRQDMVDALNSGDVDVISDTNYSALNRDNTIIHKAEIAHDVSAGGWFISNSLLNSTSQSQRDLLVNVLKKL